MPARPLTLRDVLVAKIGQLVLRAEINNVCGTNQSMVVLSYLVISYSTPNFVVKDVSLNTFHQNPCMKSVRCWKTQILSGLK